MTGKQMYGRSSCRIENDFATLTGTTSTTSHGQGRSRTKIVSLKAEDVGEEGLCHKSATRRRQPSLSKPRGVLSEIEANAVSGRLASTNKEVISSISCTTAKPQTKPRQRAVTKNSFLSPKSPIERVETRQKDSAVSDKGSRCPYIDHCRSLLDLSHHDILPFEVWAADFAQHFDLSKIAEASFGEVYRTSLRERVDELSCTGESVFKIIALQPPQATLPSDGRSRRAILARTKGMSKPGDVATEVRLLQRMSSTPGFTNFREVRIVQGRPPLSLIKAYRTFNTAQIAKGKGASIFPDPAKKSSYRDDQLWAVIEMQDAGSDLERTIESGHCQSIWFVWDIFWQVTLSLAKGEQDAEFEHRDLHLGNVCIRRSQERVDESRIDRKKKLNFTGLETTIIDYTISRCTLDSVEPSSKSVAPPDIAFHDLAMPSEIGLFEADSSEEYQYEIYRYMRSAIFMDDAAADYLPASSDQLATAHPSWRDFSPITNLIWLHFLLHKLLANMSRPSSQGAPDKKACPKAYRRWKRAVELENVLLGMQELLQPAVICDKTLESASSLVFLALGNAWLDEKDVCGQDLGPQPADDDDGDVTNMVQGVRRDGLASDFAKLRV